jgi:hypothetical protein
MIECERVDIFSDCLDQDGEAVVRAMKFLRDQEFFKEIEKGKRKLNIFCDTGPHFRNKTLNHYLFNVIERNGIKESEFFKG